MGARVQASHDANHIRSARSIHVVRETAMAKRMCSAHNAPTIGPPLVHTAAPLKQLQDIGQAAAESGARAIDKHDT